MLFKHLTLLLAALAASFALSFVSSCDKEPEDKDTLKPKYNYFPLEVGNWWVYEWYWEDVRYLDTVSVLDDSLINNTKYFLTKNSGILTIEKGLIWLRIDNNQDIWFYDQTLQKEILIISLTPPLYPDTLEFEYYRLNRIRNCISTTNMEETFFNTAVKRVTINDYAAYRREFYFANKIGIIFAMEVYNEIPWKLISIDTSEGFLLIKSCISGTITEYSFREKGEKDEAIY